jgi:hypothetical protein
MPFIQTNTKYVVNGRVMGGTMRRRVAKRTKPWLLPAAAAPAAENPALPAAAETPALPPPEDDEEGLPAAKKPRLQVPSSVSTAGDGVTTDSPDDIPTDPVFPAASIQSTVTTRARPRTWEGEEETKLTVAFKEHGKKWVAVAAMFPGRTNLQCRERWTMDQDFGSCQW